MESADFNSAAKYIFNGLRKAVKDVHSIGSIFMSVEMDPATPGVVTSAVIVPLHQEDIALAMSAHGDAAASMSAGFRQLLGHPDAPADLAVYVSPAHIESPEQASDAIRSFCLRLEIRSVDLAAVSAFRVQSGAAHKSRLLFAPLTFRGLLEA